MDPMTGRQGQISDPNGQVDSFINIQQKQNKYPKPKERK